MAERRMFTKKITDSDAFFSLPASTQALYFHLNQGADDDGFNNQIKMAMYRAHATDDDLKLLIAKSFIITFESGVIVIKHWRMHNYIRKDRYNPTTFTEEFNLLKVKNNESYEFLTENNDAKGDGCHLVANRLPQVRLGKGSIGYKENNIKESSHLAEEDVHDANTEVKATKSNKTGNNTINLETEFEEIWNIYPNKKGKDQAKTKYIKARKNGTTYDQVLQGLNSYINYIKQNNIDEQYVKHGSTWFNKKCWEDEYSKSSKKSEPSWFNQKIEKVEVSAQERKELEEMINKFKQK